MVLMSLHAVWIGILYRTEETMVMKYIISFALLSRCICGVYIVWDWCGKKAAFHFYQIQVITHQAFYVTRKRAA